MDSISELKRDISTGLQNDLNNNMLPGESIAISLPGSFGEALVVTDKRAIVIRDRESALMPVADVYAYPLNQVTGALAITSGAGGYIELRLAEPPSDPDTARVYFPAQEEAGFKAAADYLSKPRPVAQQPISAAVSAPAAGKCSACGTGLDDDAVFCPQCGVAVRTVCTACGHSTPIGSKFCAHCGRGVVEFAVACPKCASRVLKWMSFCPECGSILQPVCAGCGVQLAPDWRYCASCGRLLGADRLDPRTAGAAVRKFEQARDAEQEAPPAPIENAERFRSESTADSPAESHNKRGRELFDSEDYEGAVREFMAACVADPNNPAYHCNLAVAYDECDRDAEALAEYQKALQLDPNDLTALLSLGYMYSEAEDYAKSQEVWGRILSIAPDSAEAQEVQQNLGAQSQL